MGENGKEQIGGYELVSLIGDGAQGRVYRARCASDTLPFVKRDDEVALKVVRITGEDEKLRLKFQEQAEILRRLSHNNIVSYRDCFSWHAGEWDEAQCLVMELLEGEPLNERLKKANTGLPWPQVEEVFEQCLAGLIHARERGITHRDIKPSNIFITADGQAKLIDFDIARRDDSGQMSTAGWKGTFDYMAPDFIAIDGFRGDEISDVFSLGVCFYQALTGSLPYEPLGETAHIGYLNRWRNNAAPAPSFRPGVFRVLSYAKTVIAKSLAAKREERYPTFAAMLEDFRKIRYRRIRHKNKDEYELLAVLGRGGFGEVFKARRVSDGLLVAVKYLFSEKQSERFLREAKILQQYTHPNLVKYVDFMALEGTGGDKQLFLVMEFLEGMPGWTLRHRIKNEGRLEVAEAVALFGSYLSALQFLHGSARPIVHRDIKPGNLYAPMGQPDKAKIFDLGVARDVSGTVTVGGVPGTLDYMPPEFAEAGGDRGSPQSDLYALGLCLYEALAGKPVFARLPTNLNSAWLAFQDRIRKPPAVTFDDDVFVRHPRLRQVILKALAEKPGGRFRSAAEMRAALEEALNPGTGAEAPDGDFDAGEVTMATFTGGQNVTAEPGATLGTRPLDAAENLLGGGMDLIDAGRQEAERRKKRKRMLIVGAAAAGLAVFGVGGTLLGVMLAKRGGGSAEETARQPQGLAQTAVAETAASAEEKGGDAQARGQAEVAGAGAAQAGPSRETPERPVAAPPERDPVYQGLMSEIPGRIERDDDWLAAEAAAAKLAAQEERAWPGIDDAEKTRRVAALRALLKERAAAYVALVRDAALAAYAAGKDGKDERDRLARMGSQAPLLQALVALPLEEAVARVEAAHADFAVAETLAALPGRIAQAADEVALTGLTEAFLKLESRPGIKLSPDRVRAVEQAFADKALVRAKQHAQAAQADYAAERLAEGAAKHKALKDLVASTPPRFGGEAVAGLERDVEKQRQAAEAAVTRKADARAAKIAQTSGLLDEFDGRLRKGVLAGCADGVPLLSGIPPDLLADAGLKAKWEASRAAYAELVAQTVSQKDPLDSRAQRLKTAGEVLGDAAAETLFGAEAAVLRRALDQQMGVGILRLVNRSNGLLQVTSKELGDGAKLAGGEVKEWALPVPGETLTVSVTVRGDDRFRSRIETVKLPRAGGVERAFGEAAADLLAPPEPAVAATVQPPGGGEAVKAEAPVAPAAPAKSVAAGDSAFEITVSPKTAAVSVDGLPAAAGRVEVTPNENHKVTVECKGYKPVQQYYKVQPGETRRIDILLEKEAKKSFFGL
jgi:serine/threonine protein kinase